MEMLLWMMTSRGRCSCEWLHGDWYFNRVLLFWKDLSRYWSCHGSYIYFCLPFSYRQAQATVLKALPLLNKHDISTKRPDDYFAEMAKSDQHMQKVRGFHGEINTDGVSGNFFGS